MLNIFEDTAEFFVSGCCRNHGVKAHILFDVLDLVAFLKKFLGPVDAGGEIA